MRRYETIVIVDPDISDENRGPLLEKICDLIPKQNGWLVSQDDWGVKKLAYEIKKKTRGHYIKFDFCGDGTLVDELERSFRIDDRVMKYMTVLLDKNADPEKIKEELAAAAASTEEEVAAEESTEAAATEDTEEAAVKSEEEVVQPSETSNETPEATNPETKEEEK